jgi:hypothetical protein
MTDSNSEDSEEATINHNGDDTATVQGPNAAALKDGTDDDYNQGRADAISSGSKQKAKLTFGKGTREQAVLKVVGRGENAAEASRDFLAGLENAEENNVPQRLANLVQDGNAAFTDAADK